LAFKRVGPKSMPRGNPENGDLKTLINRQLKIRNGILYRGESTMGT
jgi:hypothetical protein